MSEELEQVGGGIQEPSKKEAQVPARPGKPTEGAELTPDLAQGDVQAQIEAAVKAKEQEWQEKARSEAQKIQSAKDKELAALRRQLRAAQQKKVDEAKALLESNPDQAANILLGLAEEQSEQIEKDGAHDELVAWQHRILADLGANPEEDQEAALLATEWGPRLLTDPNLTWDFQQEAAKLVLSREREAVKTANKELKELKESLPETVKAEVTRALVSAGIVPEPTGEGGAPSTEDDWRNLSPAELRKLGVKERTKQPIKRTR